MNAKTVADYRREAEEQERKHDALLAELEIPRYTDRQLQAQWVKSKDSSSVTGTTGVGLRTGRMRTCGAVRRHGRHDLGQDRLLDRR